MTSGSTIDEHRVAPAPQDGTGDTGAHALTEAQAGLWYAQRLDTANPIFNTAQFTDIRGALNIACFEAAVAATMRECASLQLRVIEIDGVPFGLADTSLTPHLQHVDCSGEPDPMEAARAWMSEDMNRPVDLLVGPLAAQILLRIADDHHLWYQRVHHLATDGYGMALIDARVAQIYSAGISNQDEGRPLAPLDAVWDDDLAYRRSDKHALDRTFWVDTFAQAEPVVSLAEGVPVSAHHFLQDDVLLPDDFSAALRALEARSGVSWPDILLSLCAAYVARMTGRTHTVVGAPYMGRLGSASARVPAMVMNILALPFDIDEAAPLSDFLVACARNVRRARKHGRYRSEQLRRDLGLLGGQRRLFGPLVNILPFEAAPTLAHLQTSVQVLCAGPVDDLTITFRADAVARQVGLAVHANPALYSQADVQGHLRRLSVFLKSALQSERLADVESLTTDEMSLWRSQAQGPSQPVVRTTLSALIEESMVRHGTRVAVQTDDAAIDYTELQRRSDALAERLHAQGVGRGDIVALAMPRSMELVIAMVAILRVGAAYLPLDIAHPRERLTTILESASPRLVLTLAAVRDLVPADCVWCLDAPAPYDRAVSVSDRTDAVSHRMPPQPDDRAYLIYTSGSTGAPKGVEVTHDAIVNRLLWMAAQYGFDADDRILQKTPATFDVSVWEFFLPLITGATLVVAPPESHKDPAWLAEVIAHHAITTLHFVPSMLATFLNEPAAARLNDTAELRRVFCSGEALPAAVRDRFHQVLHAELHNLYGPTEAAVDVSYWPASATDRSVPVPIGFPVWNTSLYVLDDCMRPLPVGVPGHLYIAGRQLARGYLGRPDLTAERFIADPFGAPGDRMYATGDLARRRADGALVYIGRSDHQVKIRGLRIELEEIEAVMAHATGVAQVAVIVRVDQPGQQRIVAYLVAHDNIELSVDALRSHAAQRLPDYMVPGAFVMVTQLPVTVNGKLDRNALPAPIASVSGPAARMPATSSEHAIAALFSEVLALAPQTPEVGADDDFFDLGGHSLLAAQLAAAIRKRWDIPLSLGAIFEHPTVARLAQHLDALATVPAVDQHRLVGADGFGRVMTLRRAENLPQPGERALPALFCLHPAGGLSWCYGALARTLPTDRTVYGLQARALHPDTPDAPASMQSMASDYVDTLVALQPQGPYHLAGWSVGGVIAQAMAVELHRRGLAVGVLAMLDAYPSDCWRDQPLPPADAIYKALLHIAGYDPAALIDLAMTRDGVVDFLRRSGHPLGELPDDMIDGVFRVVAQNNAMVRAHYHDAYPGPLLFFRAGLDHEGEDLFAHHWAPYVGELDVHEMPSVHAHMVGAHACDLIAPLLAASLSRRDDATPIALTDSTIAS